MPAIQKRGGLQLETLNRRFGIPTVEPGAELLAFVLPTAEVPRLDNLCAGGDTEFGTVGDRSMIQLFNPPGSGVVVILHRFWVFLETAGQINFRTHNVQLANGISTVQVLSRTLGNQPEPAARMRKLSGTGVGSTAMIFQLDTADRAYEFDLTRLGDQQQFGGPSLAEGRGFVIVPTTDDVNCGVNFLWSERVL